MNPNTTSTTTAVGDELLKLAREIITLGDQIDKIDISQLSEEEAERAAKTLHMLKDIMEQKNRELDRITDLLLLEQEEYDDMK